ncbi:ATP-binding cassette domain-containing protein [Micrococcus luteus]|uniref:ATP-binding cassette domain-containing protein n=1 Tax=Micrococcus luteus TaxID=1270 RepID=UPI00381B31EE
MVHLDDITLTFPDGDRRITAVDRVSLTARPGITGPSGSGKASLLAVAATLIRPDSGRVLVDDIDATQLTASEATDLRREKIGIVLQQPNLIPSLTANGQLAVMNELGGGPARRNRRGASGSPARHPRPRAPAPHARCRSRRRRTTRRHGRTAHGLSAIRGGASRSLAPRRGPIACALNWTSGASALIGAEALSSGRRSSDRSVRG